MLKRYMVLAVATVFFAFELFLGSATAAELDESVRTIPLNDAGETIVLSRQQVQSGRDLFNAVCAKCHAGGVNKTNPTVDLATPTLALATPPRDNLEAMVDYIENPTTYDGFTSLAELHPNPANADIFTELKNITEDDVVAIAGHVLVQPNIIGDQWGGGKYNR